VASTEQASEELQVGPTPVVRRRRRWRRQEVEMEQEDREAGGANVVQLAVYIGVSLLLIFVGIGVYFELFAGARKVAAVSDIQNAVTALQSQYATAGGTLSNVTVAELGKTASGIAWVDGSTASTAPSNVSVAIGSNGQSATFAAEQTGTCYFAIMIQSSSSSALSKLPSGDGPGTYYATSKSGTCDADSAPTGTAWSATAP